MRLLSYPLGAETPTFLDNPPVTVRQVSSIAAGANVNRFEVTTINHNGTHVDAPYHFWQKGPQLTDLPLDAFVFTRPLLVDITKADGELISAADLAPDADRFAAADLLLVCTGFGRHRASESVRYGRRAPGVQPDAADVLLAPSTLHALAMDVSRASSPTRLDEGRRFHQEILGTTGRGRYLLLAEDIRLDPELTQADLGRVLVVPLFLLDDAPARMAERARESVAAGYTALKALVVPIAAPLDHQAALRHADRCLATIRAAVGDDVDVMVNLHGRTTPAMAIQYGRILTQLCTAPA